MVTSAQENRTWVRWRVQLAGLTDSIEAEAAEVARARLETELL